MPEVNFPVIDCGGHILESIPEMAEFMEPVPRGHALHSYRNREGVFPSLDGLLQARSRNRLEQFARLERFDLFNIGGIP